MEKTAPVRKTKLAYVDSNAKPPRNILSKQAKYGTDRAPIVSPAARVAALQNASANITKVGDSRLKIAPGTRDNAQVQGMYGSRAVLIRMNSIFFIFSSFSSTETKKSPADG